MNNRSYEGFLSSAGILEPSVAQPPLPLQEFFALQPWSLVLQPPLPLQEFLPAQECFSTFAVFLVDFLAVLWLAVSWAAGAAARATVPPSKPVSAAVRISEFFETFMPVFLLECFN